MSGIFEEALYAFDAGKTVFLSAEYGGAAAMLAKWLLNPRGVRPPELTPEYYEGEKSDPPKTTYQKMLSGFGLLPGETPHLLTPEAAFDRLWKHIDSCRGRGGLEALLRNGLDEEENRELLPASSSGGICPLIWKGVAALQPPPPH